MNFDADFSSKIAASLFGAILGSSVTAWWTNRRNQRDLCLKVYERWTSSSLIQNRKRAFKPLKQFFEPILLEPDKHSTELVKLSELQYLSKPHSNYQPAEYWSEDFIDDFLQVTTFLGDLSKLMKRNLVDVKLSRELFRDTVLPWYRYFERLEFDLSNEMDNKNLKLEIDLLQQLMK
jgi:hypothetical protein